MSGDLYRRGKRLLSRPLTLLLIPPRGAKTKAVSMPFWLAACICLMIFVFLTGSALSYYSAWRARSDQKELLKLRQVNKQHQEELLSLRQEAVEAKSYLEEVQGLDQRIREKAGIEGKSSSYRSSSSGALTPKHPVIFSGNPVPKKNLCHHQRYPGVFRRCAANLLRRAGL